MSVIVKMRRQDAVWWRRTGVGNYGAQTFAAPVAIRCRWQQKAMEYLAPSGETRTTRAVVYVDRTVQVGDRLKQGELDSNTPLNPMTDRNAFEVMQFADLPNFRATEHLLTAYL